MKKAAPLLFLLALAAVGLLAWSQGLFVAGGGGADDGVPTDLAPGATGEGGTLAGAGRSGPLPDKDPATFEGDPVGRADVGLGRAAVTGRVVTVEGPVRFARVAVVLPPPTTAAVRTRRDGTFEVRGLPAGDLDLRVSAPDLVSRTFAVPGLVDGPPRDLGDLLLKARPTMQDGLEVKVLDEAARPLAGARVTASTLPWGLTVTLGARAGVPDSITREATTDDLGVARIAPLPAERYDVVVRAAEHTMDGVASVVVAAGRVEHLVVTLKRALTIEGIVTDAEDAPVSGAYVTGLAVPSFRSYETVLSDASGRFTLGGLASGGYMLVGGRDDKGDGMTPNVKAGDRNVKIRLSGAGLLRGRVVEADGKPATKFTVRAYTGEPFRYNYSTQHAFEDPDGRFRLPLRPGAFSLDVKSASGAFTTTKAVTVTAGEGAELEVRLPAAGVVMGVVTDPDGHHVGGAEVFVKRGGFPPEPVRELYVRADGEGHFVLKGLPLEPVKLHCRHAGFATTEVTTTAVPLEGAKEVTVRLSLGARVVGRVATRSGVPQAGLQVNLSQGFDFFGARTTFTAADGGFAFVGVAAGDWQVTTGRFENAAAGQRKSVSVPASGEVTVTFETADDAEGTASVVGKVTVAGKPAAKATVFGEDLRGADASVSAETDGNGGFRLVGLKPGRIRVWVQTANGLSDAETVNVTDPATPATVEFTFGSAGLRATLVGPDGRTPVSGAWVTVELEATGTGNAWEGVRAQVNSDASGVVAALGLAPGTYRLRIAGAGHAAKLTDAFPLGDGESKDLGTIRLAAGGGITGKVTNGAGEPVEGIGVSVRDQRGQSVFLFNMASTGSNGRYELQGVELGTYRVRFEGKGYAPVEKEVAVTAAGAVADAVMVKGGAVAVRVEDAGGQPVAGARVVLLDASGKRLEKTLSIVNLFDADVTRTGDAGTTTIPDLAPGTYRATAEREGMTAGDPVGFTVDAGGRTTVTVVLTAPR